MKAENSILHVYLMPGMAANPSIFEYIKLPVDVFEVHLLSWKIPLQEETLSDYALRMLEEVHHENFALVGVSFGGVVVQEMAKLRTPKRLIIVSSVKSSEELPPHMRFAQKTKAYKVLPLGLLNYMHQIEKLPVGNFIKKRIQLYRQYLSVSEKEYLEWAVENMVCWNQTEILPEIIHIHGTADQVFPAKLIKDFIPLKDGTHIMILNKYKWFNKHLPNLLLNKKLAD
jgi:pimeloyl-ACP methyl ester carboxylesterase